MNVHDFTPWAKNSSNLTQYISFQKPRSGTLQLNYSVKCYESKTKF